MKVRRIAIDAWIDRYMRRRAGIEAPPSATGAQLARMRRLGTSSAGKKHAARIEMENVQGSAGGKWEQAVIGRRRPEMIPARGGGHSGSESAALERLAEHAEDAAIWRKVPMLGRIILDMQRTALSCPGGRRRAEAVQGEVDEERGERRLCAHCGVRFTAEVMAADAHGRLEIAPPHALTVAIARERPLSWFSEGSGEELGERVRAVDGSVTDFWRMTAREPIYLSNAQIAEVLQLSPRQVHRHVAGARAIIAAELRRIAESRGTLE